MTNEELTRLAKELRRAAETADDPVLVCRLDAGAWAVDRLVEQTVVATTHEPLTGL